MKSHWHPAPCYRHRAIGKAICFLLGLSCFTFGYVPQNGGSPFLNTAWAAPVPADDRDDVSEDGGVSKSDNPSQDDSVRITLPRATWKTAGIEIKRPEKKRFSESIRLTGKVSLNEDRISHIYPMVEGAVDSVAIALGEVVDKEQLLVVVHSREVGEAKLELFQARLQLEMADVKDRLEQELAANTRQLLEALRQKKDITEILEQLSNRNMGEYRERLLNAYADFIKAEADVTRLEGIGESGAISGKQLLAARARRNADLATFQARIEQIAFELQTSLLATSQAVREANTRVAVATTNLRILGCEESEIESIDPMQQGESISHYSIRAPFAGTVIAKDVTLGEQVRPDSQILTVADLSTVWIKADIYEKDVPLLRSLTDSEITFASEAWPNQTFSAKVFYTGEIMDEATRTVGLRAIAKNDEHLLKPGMFVTIHLPAKASQESVQVPSTAVQQHEGKDFVFIHAGDDAFLRRDIVLGRSDRQWSVIEQGLDGTEPVVTSGGFILKSKMLEGLLAEE